MSRSCFHCGLDIPDTINLNIVINQQSQPMCCQGCHAVATAIVENGLEHFYQHRTHNGNKPEVLLPDELNIYDHAGIQQAFIAEVDGDIQEVALVLEGIHCAACVWLNERHIGQLEGVSSFHVNYTTHRAQLRWDTRKIQLSYILQEIQAIGYKAHPYDIKQHQQLQQKERYRALKRIAIAGLAMMQVMMPSVALYLSETHHVSDAVQQLLRWISLLITTPVVVYSAQYFFTGAWHDLRNKRLGVDVPVALAIGIAFLASLWAVIRNQGDIYFESIAMFVFLLLLGRYLEMQARHHATDRIDHLSYAKPLLTHRYVSAAGSSMLETLPASELQRGDDILVKAGETFPADGVVISGQSDVSESLLSGESRPLLKQQGDKVIAGSINLGNALDVNVTETEDDTVLASIVKLLNQAQQDKPEIARFADRIAQWFVPIVLLVAVSVFLIWYSFAPDRAFWVALSVLIVTCPCALSLATPIALSTATTALSKSGLFIVRPHVIEGFVKLTDIVFDKTGTLTQGNFTVQKTELLADYSEQSCLQIAAELEKNSTHPLAAAFANYADVKQQSLTMQLIEIKAHHSLGVEAILQDTNQQDRLRLGSRSFVEAITPYAFPDTAGDYKTLYLGTDKSCLAIFYLQDNMRTDTVRLIRCLHEQHYQTHLLSGDQQAVVTSFSKVADIKQFKAALMPEDKLDYIKALQADDKIVLMVGDGINDAPVLSAASVSIAMGEGTDLAQSSADAVLMSENIYSIYEAIMLSQKTFRIIRQNYAWAIGYNLIALPFAAMGWVQPWMAAIGMSASSLLVVLNSLRLNK